MYTMRLVDIPNPAIEPYAVESVLPDTVRLFILRHLGVCNTGQPTLALDGDVLKEFRHANTGRVLGYVYGGVLGCRYFNAIHADQS